MKLCYICSEYPPALHGGIGSVVQASARALVQQGHQVRVIGMYPPEQKTVGYEEDQGVQVWRLAGHSGRAGWMQDRWELYRTLHAWADAGLIDMVEVPDWAGYACLWPSLGIPVVVRLHGSVAYFAGEMKSPVSARMRWLESRSFHRADFCSSCSQYTADKTTSLFGAHRRPAQVIYNSVALTGPTGVETRRRNMVIYAGTLTKKKGIGQLVRAWAEVHSQRPDVELHVYGKDAGMATGHPLIPHLKSLLSASALASVHFHGHIAMTDLRALYKTCGMAIFPSYAEAFAMAPMEAMAEACPVITSSRTSGPELITDGVNGLLVDPDNVDQIAAKILRMLSDNRLADQLGQAGRETIRTQFNASDMAGRLSEYYLKCIETYQPKALGNARPALTRL